MIGRGFLFSALLSVFVAFHAPAQSVSAPTSLKLLPAPKEVRISEGKFEITSRTRILVEAGHAAEDRNAAETLRDEIEQQSGLKISIESSRRAPDGEGVIVLGRLSDAGVRSYFEGKGLQTD